MQKSKFQKGSFSTIFNKMLVIYITEAESNFTEEIDKT